MPPSLNDPEVRNLPSTPVQVRIRAIPASTPPTTYHGTHKSRSGGTHSIKRQKVRHTPVYTPPDQLKAEHSHRQRFDSKPVLDPIKWSHNLRRNRRIFSPGNSPTRAVRSTNRPGSLRRGDFLGGSEEYIHVSNLGEKLPLRTGQARVMIPPYDPEIPMHSISDTSRYRTHSIPIHSQYSPNDFEEGGDYAEFGEFGSKERNRRPNNGSEDELSRDGFPSDDATTHRNIVRYIRSRLSGTQKQSRRKMHESNSESSVSSSFEVSSSPRLRKSRRTKTTVVKEDEGTPVIDLSDDDDEKNKPLDKSAEKWSEKNLKWKENWRHTVTYGERPNKANVEKRDIKGLDEGEWMNDNLIEFHLRWLERHLQPGNSETATKIHICNTFFYTQLTSNTGNRRINYEGVKNWIKVDIFDYDYIIVPINEEDEHWYVAIICNPSKLLAPKDSIPSEEAAPTVNDDTSSTSRKRPLVRKYDPSHPRIMTLDSLHGNKHAHVCTKLKDYLTAEAQAKRKVQVNWPEAIGISAIGLPFQTNSADCGAFLCSYIEEFMTKPREMARKILQKEALEPIVFQKPSVLRNVIRDRLFEAQEEQNAEEDAKKAEKKGKNTAKDVKKPAKLHER